MWPDKDSSELPVTFDNICYTLFQACITFCSNVVAVSWPKLSYQWEYQSINMSEQTVYIVKYSCLGQIYSIVFTNHDKMCRKWGI